MKTRRWSSLIWITGLCLITITGAPVSVEPEGGLAGDHTTLTWSTFLGGISNDNGYGIALDGSGNIYVAGNSQAGWGSPIRRQWRPSWNRPK